MAPVAFFSCLLTCYFCMTTENSEHPISLFKFRAGNDNDLDSLRNDYLWFPSCDDLNDPFEGVAFIDYENVDGALYQDFRKAFNLKYQDSSSRHACDNDLGDKDFAFQWFNTFIAQWRQNTAVFSGSKDYQFSSGRPETPHVLSSMSLWGHYANGLRGYCIEFDFPKLQKSLTFRSKDRSIGSSDVDYSDLLRPVISLKTYLEGFITGNLDKTRKEVQTAFSTKHTGTWDYEQEVRFFGVGKGQYHFDPGCIRAVYLGEKMPDKEKQAIRTCLQSKGTNIDIAEICIDVFDKNYQLRVRSYP